MIKSPYEVLGVDYEATPSDIKKRAEEKAAAIKTAFEILSHPEKRQQFDAEGQSGKSPTIDYYAVLGLQREVSAIEIKQAAQTEIDKVKIAYLQLMNAHQPATSKAKKSAAPKKRRYSLITLVVVILLIGLGIFSAGTTTYQLYFNRFKAAEAVALMSVLKKAAEQYLTVKSEFPASVEILGGKSSGLYTAQIIADQVDFYFQATMKPGGLIGEKTIRLSYDPDKKSWSCEPGKPNGIDSMYLPSDCR